MSSAYNPRCSHQCSRLPQLGISRRSRAQSSRQTSWNRSAKRPPFVTARPPAACAPMETAACDEQPTDRFPGGVPASEARTRVGRQARLVVSASEAHRGLVSTLRHSDAPNTPTLRHSRHPDTARHCPEGGPLSRIRESPTLADTRSDTTRHPDTGVNRHCPDTQCPDTAPTLPRHCPDTPPTLLDTPTRVEPCS